MLCLSKHLDNIPRVPSLASLPAVAEQHPAVADRTTRQQMPDTEPGEHTHPVRVSEIARQMAQDTRSGRPDKYNMRATRVASYEKILLKTLQPRESMAVAPLGWMLLVIFLTHHQRTRCHTHGEGNGWGRGVLGRALGPRIGELLLVGSTAYSLVRAR